MMDVQTFPKPRTLRSLKNIADYKQLHRWCEMCGREPVVIHHLKTRASGGSDEPGNLIALDFECHNRVHQDADFRRLLFEKKGLAH